MPTPLTVYLTSTNDTLVTTAKQLTPSAPAGELSNGSKVGKSTGWGVLWAQGNSGAWAGGASEPTFGDVHGFILDSTLLEGQQIVAGSWSCSIKLSLNTSSLTATAHVRVGARSSAGVYTQIIDMATASSTISTTASVLTASGSTGAATNFNVGDKLYVEVDLNITVASGSTTATAVLFFNGGANESIVTPGYQAQPSQPWGWSAHDLPSRTENTFVIPRG